MTELVAKITAEDVNNSMLKMRVKTILSDSGITEATEEDILLAAQMEMAGFPNEVSISAGETRQVKQYSPNNYHLSMKLDITDLKDVTLNSIQEASEGNVLSQYVKSKTMMYQSLSNKIERGESYLRDQISQMKSDDGLPDV